MERGYHHTFSLAKARFVKRLMWHRLKGQPKKCPNCRSVDNVFLFRRKKLIIDILRCDKCKLIFRWPIDTTEELDAHYENKFAEDAPQVRLPDPSDLPQLKAGRFASLFGPDLNHKMDVLHAIRPSGHILDFGCSWGYASHLMQIDGYRATGFEVSRTRGKYAEEHLGVPVILRENLLPSGCFDIVYSNNVLEHLPEIGQTIKLFARILKPGGLAIHVLPNFSELIRRNHWLHLVGEDHPVAPTIEFFSRSLTEAGFSGFAFASTPLNDSALASVKSLISSQLQGDELLLMAQR